MPNTRHILIVDDDPELREALMEQLSLHEEFEAVAAENGSKGVQAAKAGHQNQQSLRQLKRRLLIRDEMRIGALFSTGKVGLSQLGSGVPLNPR